MVTFGPPEAIIEFVLRLFNGTKWEKQLLPSLGWSIDRRAAFEAHDGSLWFGSSSDINTDKGQKGGLVRYIKPELNNYSHIEYEYHFPNKNWN